MAAFGNTIEPTEIHHLLLVHDNNKVENAIQDDGLGCARGVAFAMLANLLFGVVAAGGWAVWHLLR